jgi:exopolysaccharide production protein ExoZ
LSDDRQHQRARGPEVNARWESLHILRAVASLVVVAHHVPHFLDGRVRFAVHDFDAGAVGVDIFFVISGFVMYCATSQKSDSWHVFLAKRAIRVIPMYWLVTIAVTAAVWCVPSAFAHFRVSGETLLKSLAFIPTYNEQGDIRPVIAVGWTLYFELLFYALVAAALPLGGRRASLIAAAAVVVATLMAAVLALPRPYSAWQLLRPIAIEFALGVGLAHTLHRTRVLQLPIALRLALSAAAMGCGLYLISRVSFHAPAMNRFQFWGIGALLTVSALALLEPELARMTGLRRFYSGLGDASYSLYLIHGSVFPVVWKLMPQSLHESMLLAWAVLMVAPVAACFPAHYWVEVPLTRGLTSLRKRSPTRVSQPATRSMERYEG